MGDSRDDPLDAWTAINDDVGSLNACTGQLEYSQYGYNMTEGRAITILAIFSLLTLAHFLQALLSRRWFLIPTVCLCALGEVIGWAARLISARTTEWHSEFGGYWYSSKESFMAQIATLIIAPVFLTAGWYILLGRLIRLLGPQYGRLHYRTYALMFVTADVVCLVVQAIGGGAAASADTDEDAETGAHTMVAGVFLQMAVMVGFVLIFIDFVIAYRKRRPVSQIRFAFWKPKPSVDAVSPGDLAPDVERKAQYLLWATGVSVLMVFVRSIYRCIELLDGWDGAIIQNEVLFCTLDALPIAVALVVYNVVHPMWYLGQARETKAGDEIALAEKKEESPSGSVLPAN